MTTMQPLTTQPTARGLEYEMPTLIEIGDASDLVLGIVGGGFDGDFGMTEAQFEFEADADPI